MQNSQNKRILHMVLIVLIAVSTIGIGYASITAVNLIISGNATYAVRQDNYDVHFLSSDGITGSMGVGGTSSIDENDNKIAYFDVSGLTKRGDYAEATYTIINNSNDIGVDISVDLDVSNNNYFYVSSSVKKNKLKAGETTTATIHVTLKKTPIDESVSTNVTSIITASPIEDDLIIDSSPISVDNNDVHTYTYEQAEYRLYEPLPNGVRTFGNAKDLFNDVGEKMGLAHIENDDKDVISSYVTFGIDRKVYYLQSGIDESNSSGKYTYKSNKKIMDTAFGEENCSENTRYGEYYCSNDDGLSATVYCSGVVIVNKDPWACFYYPDGYSGCCDDGC